MKIINATPHAINVVKGGDIVTFQPSGMVARVDMTTNASTLNLDGFNVSCNQAGDVVGIPPQQDGVYYIVSAVVLGNSTRSDLIAPDTNRANRNDLGHIVSVPGFVANR